MKILIRNIAQIQSGLYATLDGQGDAAYLQVRHFKKNGELNGAIKTELLVDNKIEKHILQDNDILFMAKGSRNDAVVYHEKIVGSAAASLSFIIVRVREKFKDQVLPEYLSWFINHPRSQQFLKAHAKGSGIPSIALSAFAQLEVTIPPIEKQKIILSIHKLRAKEQTLVAELDRLKDHFIQHQLLSATQQ